MSYSELLIAMENIIIDKGATVPTARNRKIDTSAPIEIGMAAKDDGESLREEGDQRIVESWISRCRLSTKEQAKENEALERVRDGMNKDTKVAKRWK